MTNDCFQSSLNHNQYDQQQYNNMYNYYHLKTVANMSEQHSKQANNDARTHIFNNTSKYQDSQFIFLES